MFRKNDDCVARYNVVKRLEAAVVAGFVDAEEKQSVLAFFTCKGEMTLVVRWSQARRISTNAFSGPNLNSGFVKIALPDVRVQYVDPADDSPIPSLTADLNRVLFSPGVHALQCPRSGVFNFDQRLKQIIQPSEFNFDLIRGFVPSSKDKNLHQMTLNMGCKFATSTSSLSGPLSLLYFCLFGLEHTPNLDSSSLNFKNEPFTFTNLLKYPVSFTLEPHLMPEAKGQNHIYSILIEKTSAVDEDMILMKMGNILEMKLTHSPDTFEAMQQTTTSQSLESPPAAYAYCKSSSLLVRSQIDCGDKRLPRRTFDIKTRACLPVRMDPTKYQEFMNYKIAALYGLYNSFEREYFDMARSAFLKYSFQVKLGNMDGIFAAFHNVFEIFGFQYIPREEMDQVLFGNSVTGEICHQFLLKLFTVVMERILDVFPYSKEPIRVIFDVKKHKLMNIFVERCPLNSPFNAHSIPVSLHQFTLHLYSQINGIRTENLLLDANGSDELNVFYQINHIPSPLLSEYLQAKKRMTVLKSSNDSFIQSIPCLRKPTAVAKKARKN